MQGQLILVFQEKRPVSPYLLQHCQVCLSMRQLEGCQPALLAQPADLGLTQRGLLVLWVGMPKRPEAAAWGAQAKRGGCRDILCKQGNYCCHLFGRQR